MLLTLPLRRSLGCRQYPHSMSLVNLRLINYLSLRIFTHLALHLLSSGLFRLFPSPLSCYWLLLSRAIILLAQAIVLLNTLIGLAFRLFRLL